MFFRPAFLIVLLAATNVMAAPDVIVAELFGETFSFDTVRRWGKLNAAHPITAYSVGTISCNLGADPVEWDISSNHHPVIGSQLYRLMDGRFEQIGLSWVKHGYLALDDDLCSPGGCTAPPSSHPDWGRFLFPGCSDPYSSNLNGSQIRLGPRSEINVVTGSFGTPFKTAGQTGDTIYKRLQVHDVDIDPDLNPGALYYIEGQYVTFDDTAAGTNHNNASYRQVLVSENTPGIFTMMMTGSTVREQSAIYAWAANDPNVQIETIMVPSDGIFRLASNVTDLGNGEYEYEYALYNQDSHRSAGSISIPLGTGASASDLGFHDVDYHGGDGEPAGTGVTYSGTDWTPTIGANSVSWATVPFATNINANAVRWGTVYNFRFQSNGAPKPGLVTVGLFRPGSPTTFTIAADVPDDFSTPLVLGDMDANGVVDMPDVPLFVALLLDPSAATMDAKLRGDMDVNLSNDSTDVQMFIDALAP